jgi:Rrf2 family protein
MKVNTKTRYGLRALVEIASGAAQDGVYQKQISRNQDISYKYLDLIIAELKSSNLITTVTGKKSGYRLKRDPGTISVYDVYSAFNQDLALVHCLCEEGQCKREGKCAARGFWEGLNDELANHLKSVTIFDLAKKQAELESTDQDLVYHI